MYLYIYGSNPMKTGNMCMKHSSAPSQNSTSLKGNWTGSRADENQKTDLRNLILINAIVKQITAC